MPKSGTVFISLKDGDKKRVLPTAKLLTELGFKIIATSGTQRFLEEHGVPAAKINKVLEGRPHIEDAIRNRQVQIVFNTTDGQTAVSDSKSLRRATLMQKVPYYTTLAGAAAVAEAIAALKAGSNQMTSAHIEMVMEAEGQTITMSGDTKVDAQNPAMQMSMDMGGAMKLDMILLDKVLYLQGIPGLGDGKWAKMAMTAEMAKEFEKSLHAE